MIEGATIEYLNRLPNGQNSKLHFTSIVKITKILNLKRKINIKSKKKAKKSHANCARGEWSSSGYRLKFIIFQFIHDCFYM